MENETDQCPDCKDIGYILSETDDGRQVATECECHKQARIRKRLERYLQHSTVGRRYHHMTLDNFEAGYQDVALRIVRDYVSRWRDIQERGLWLVFMGPPATGKSHLAAACWNALRERDVPGCMVRVSDLLDEFRPGAGEDRDRHEKMRVIQSAPFLVLDDLGAQKTTEWVTEMVYRIIEARQGAMLPTIITTNLTLAHLEELGGAWPAIVSRIVGCAKVVRMDGEDYRKKHSPGRTRT